jgi:hypothetical protein
MTKSYQLRIERLEPIGLTVAILTVNGENFAMCRQDGQPALAAFDPNYLAEVLLRQEQ